MYNYADLNLEKLTLKTGFVVQGHNWFVTAVN